MESKIFLTITDSRIRNIYAQDRNKDIIVVNLVIWLVRVVTVLCGIVSAIINERKFTDMYWVVRCVGLGY